MDEAQNVQLVRDALAAADRGDALACEAAMHPDLVVTMAGVPEAIAGRDAWMGGVLEMSTAFPDLRTSVLDAVASDDRVAVRSVITGTHRGSFTGIEASGRSIEVMSHDFYRIEAGRIVEAWIVTDIGTLFSQIS
ncbi:ester cyclase [Agrococcus sp. ARC_14]|uniref:ester cyclase n=1 Tax=Agrococcus sp. ARC_14 TaxID=2919927 RepID=UPI001F05EA64|nr:ester cyclase [Agrococcus sp. ARC_14]MCH1882142.1 ester cyclase [Agrococcus sp. ARC_14]